MYVIPLIMTEEAVMSLPDEYLSRLAECSTDIIKDKIIEYIKNPEANSEVKSRIETAYGLKIALQEYLESDDTREKAELISGLTYDGISLTTDLNLLRRYKEAIESILASNFAIPYVPPIEGELIKTLREDIVALGKDTKNAYITRLGNGLKQFSDLFRDSPHAVYKGTVVKKVIRNKGKYEIILKGINFLIDKKERNLSPTSWRYL